MANVIKDKNKLYKLVPAFLRSGYEEVEMSSKEAKRAIDIANCLDSSFELKERKSVKIVDDSINSLDIGKMEGEIRKIKLKKKVENRDKPRTYKNRVNGKLKF